VSIWSDLLYTLPLVPLLKYLTTFSNGWMTKIYDKACNCVSPIDIPSGSDIYIYMFLSYNRPGTYQLQKSGTEHSSTFKSHSHKLQQT
jgi:hypothetical protein